jgi:dsRNA-specific ribonuclease
MLAGESPTFSTVAGMLIIVSSLVIYFKGAEIVKYISTRIKQHDMILLTQSEESIRLFPELHILADRIM